MPYAVSRRPPIDITRVSDATVERLATGNGPYRIAAMAEAKRRRRIRESRERAGYVSA